jgi:hypothetical protein
MIASIERPKPKTQTPAWHATFLSMLPAIHHSARVAFRKAGPELRQELVQEVEATCFAAYARLVELGKAELAFPSALARFAISQVRVGRGVGKRLRIREVMSGYAQHRKGFQVERLDHFDEEQNCWKEALLEDKRATPADIAACRIDFASWLKLLPGQRREIALTLAGGETTSGTAKLFGVSPARISQIRDLLRKSWERFQAAPEIGARPQPAAA